MGDIPIPSITGGAAGPSQVLGGGKSYATVFSTANSGSGLWYSIAAIALGYLWLKHHKK